MSCTDDWHGCYEECEWWWCNDCEELHEPNTWCENGVMHQEYCDCSDCRPAARTTSTIIAAGDVL